MKTIKKLSAFLILSLLVCSLFSCKSAEPEPDYLITLHVDTENFDPRNPKASCHFSVKPPGADETPPNGDPLKDFTVKVKTNRGTNPKIVEWDAVSVNEEVEVKVERIVMVGGTNVFPPNLIISGRNGRVRAKTNIPTLPDKPPYIYHLHFTVDGHVGQFMIDPKLPVQ